MHSCVFDSSILTKIKIKILVEFYIYIYKQRLGNVKTHLDDEKTQL